MNKWYVILILALSIGTCLLNAQVTYAKPDFKFGHGGYHRPPQHPRPMTGEDDYCQEQKQLENDARNIIHRTAFVLHDAQEAAYHGHYSFGLAQAAGHQEQARDLYWHEQYREAIYHSLRARELAFQIIRGNREQCRPDYGWDETENNYRHESPRDGEPKLQIRWRLHNDKEVILLHLNWDLDK